MRVEQQPPIGASQGERASVRFRRVPFTLVGCITVLILVSLFVWLNISRERIKDEAVRANLQTIVTQAYIVKSDAGSYGATLIAVRVSNGYSEEYCTAMKDSFLLVVSRPNRGFYKPNPMYWCADSAGQVCPVGSPSGSGEGTCGCS
jgi:hypothetical protein